MPYWIHEGGCYEFITKMIISDSFHHPIYISIYVLMNKSAEKLFNESHFYWKLFLSSMSNRTVK